jgi:hypothetical protein
LDILGLKVSDTKRQYSNVQDALQAKIDELKLKAQILTKQALDAKK